MGIQKLGLAPPLWIGMVLLLVAGCNPAQPSPAQNQATNSDSQGESSETQQMAEAALGKQAEVLAHGDLARNGLEQILAVNRNVPGSNRTNDAKPPVVTVVTRAAILQKNNGKWSEVLRCDEYLKNPNGYLAGSPEMRVTGWQLEFIPDMKRGLELKFTPIDATGKQEWTAGDRTNQALVVRWNAAAKRYQSMGRSDDRFLNEVPTLETPQSFLR